MTFTEASLDMMAFFNVHMFRRILIISKELSEIWETHPLESLIAFL